MSSPPLQPPKKKNNRWLVVTSLVAFAALAVWVVTSGGINLASTQEALGRYGLSTLALAFAAVTVELLFYCLRLWALVPPEYNISPISCARSYLYGQGLNAFVPARAGDAIKALVLTRSGMGVSLALAVGVLLSDKLIDTVSFVLLCLTASTQLLGRLGWRLPGPGGILGIILGFGGLILLIRALKTRPTLPRGLNWIKQVGGGISRLKSPKATLIALIFSCLGWVFELAALGFLAQAQGIPLTFTDRVWVIAMVNLGTAIPVSFANLGPFEASIVFALKQLGVDESVALAIAVAHHAMQMVTVLFWAGVFRLGELVRGR